MKTFTIDDVVRAVMSLDGASSLAPRQVSTAIQLALRRVVGLYCLGGSDLTMDLENGNVLRCSLVGADEQQPVAAPPKFPVALRKMWSGGEVQQWIDANWPKGGTA